MAHTFFGSINYSRYGFTSTRKMKKRKLLRLAWFTLVLMFFVWQWSTYQSRDLPGNTFTSDDKVSIVEDESKITFQASSANSKYEVIFFQGGLTDPYAYAPLCRGIAQNGFTCHLIKMDWRMPQWGYNKIIDLFELGLGDFILGGHSQGGKMAAQFVYENPGLLKGLFLLGTSHPRDVNLSDRNIPTIKLYAEYDGLASVAEVMENRSKLPAGSKLKVIRGGNHSQFGYLGKLLTDESASIQLEEQQQLTLQSLVSFFAEVKSRIH